MVVYFRAMVSESSVIIVHTKQESDFRSPFSRDTSVWRKAIPQRKIVFSNENGYVSTYLNVSM